jgi:hypothetical protein
MRVLPSASFLEATDKYDLIVNAYSLTAMAQETASQYWEKIRTRSPTFLSISHESKMQTCGLS